MMAMHDRLTFLLVGNSPALLALEDRISRLGRITCEAAGRQALHHARRQLPHIIVLASSIPDMCVPFFQSILRHDPRTTHIPLILFGHDFERAMFPCCSDTAIVLTEYTLKQTLYVPRVNGMAALNVAVEYFLQSSLPAPPAPSVAGATPTLDSTRMTVRYGATEVTLGRVEFTLCQALTLAEGRTLACADLATHLYPAERYPLGSVARVHARATQLNMLFHATMPSMHIVQAAPAGEPCTLRLHYENG